MNIVTTRFGLIQASESELFRIPEGLLGFRSYTQYLSSSRSGGDRPDVVAKRDRA